MELEGRMLWLEWSEQEGEGFDGRGSLIALTADRHDVLVC